MNIDPSATKYMVKAKINADGIGRIEVEITSKGGKSEGIIYMSSSLDQVETVILASALETVDRVGPCKASIHVLGIEDVRVTKREKVVERAKGYAAESGTTFKQVNTMAEAFEGADIVIPKSWAPFAAMEKRTNLYAEGDDAGIAALEKELLAQNATHQDWCSTTELMEKTANGQDTIFMHPLPADISGVSCEHGEVNADVFDMHRVGMYKEASYKPYAIAAMMFLQKVADPAATLKALDERNTARWFQA